MSAVMSRKTFQGLPSIFVLTNYCQYCVKHVVQLNFYCFIISLVFASLQVHQQEYQRARHIQYNYMKRVQCKISCSRSCKTHDAPWWMGCSAHIAHTTIFIQPQNYLHYSGWNLYMLYSSLNTVCSFSIPRTYLEQI